MINNILKNKFLVTALVVSLLILILVLILSPKKSTNPAGPPKADDSRAPSTLSTLVPLNLSQEKRDAVVDYTNNIKSKLPLTVESFMTTAGIETAISITHLDSDPAEIVHLSIAGLSYIGKNELDESKNPNVTAFKESFLKAIDLLESQNIDPKKLIFAYSDVPYVRETATYWVDQLNLLP